MESTKQTSNEAENGNKSKPLLAEVFIGTAIEIKEFFNKKWCRLYGISEDKWNLIAPSTIDGIKIKNTETNNTMEFWAGSSGCNFMAVDKTGGCHNFTKYDKDVYEVLV